MTQSDEGTLPTIEESDAAMDSYLRDVGDMKAGKPTEAAQPSLADSLRAEEGIGENKAVVPETEETRSLSYRKAGSSCLWCGEEMDHNCGYGACGNCCASLGNICHESPRGYEWLKKVVLSNIAKVEKRNSR